MTYRKTLAASLFSIAGSGLLPQTHAGEGSLPILERMPEALELAFAKSAAPPHIREGVSVWLLDPAQGYYLAEQGSNGVECLVSRTAYERADFRDDIYVPLCYDAAGSATYLKVLRDVADLRISGMGPDELRAEIDSRYDDGTYSPPDKAGLSYMVAPIMRTWTLPDMNVHARPMPHLMYYAPYVSDVDIAASMSGDIRYPFIFKEGHAAQSYMIHVASPDQQEDILDENSALLASLCAYRDVLCSEAD
ncbi:hypothetical protein [Henriciella pelagia]|jgi:hypothetical protein|uniref:Uncharacterized protein n=1 Tax=Henriciella pelagia TaxID=1977912 RepID=A0ABQ1J1F7_9PROT|nr:hypothetical protein [Henriciella pelagia]GGB56518.1 hypothetical protein GCM10011503_01060 [Henriciella pelagia]